MTAKFNIRTSRTPFVASFVSNTGNGLISIIANNSNLTSSNVVYVGSHLGDKEAYISVDNEKLARFNNDYTVLQGHLLPASNLYDIGNDTYRYSKLYIADKIHINNASMSLSANRLELSNIAEIKLQTSVSSNYSIIESNDNGIVTLACYSPTHNLIRSVEIGDGSTSVLTEGSNLFFTYERAGNIAQASNLDTSNYILSLTADHIQQGSYRKFIENGIIPYDLRIDATLTASNLQVIGSSTTINTNTYTTENLEIISEAPDSSALKVVQNGVQNIAEFYSNTTELITIANNGYLGIGITTPAEKLHIDGNIILTGSINNISSNTLAYLSNVSAPIQLQLNNLSYAIFDTSNNSINHTNATSNSLINYTNTSTNATSNSLIDHTNTASNNLIAYTITTSNNLIDYTITTSNNLINYTNASTNAASNNLINYTNASTNAASNNLINYTNASTNAASNNLINYTNASTNAASNNLINYTNATSNSLINHTNTTSNSLINYTNTSTNAASNNLINYTNTASNNLLAYTIITSNSLIDHSNTASNNLIAYTITTSNNLINYTITTSNSLINYTNTSTNATSNNLINYTNATSNSLINHTNTTSNSLIDYTNTTSNSLIDYTITTSNSLIDYTYHNIHTTSNNLIDYTYNSFHTTSNSLIDLINTTSNNLIDYTNATSNNLINYINTTSNNLLSLINNDSTTSNNLIDYINTTSNNLLSLIKNDSTTSNSLIDYINTTSNNLIDYTNTTSNNIYTSITAIQSALNNKQGTLTAGTGISIDSSSNIKVRIPTSAPANSSYLYSDVNGDIAVSTYVNWTNIDNKPSTFMPDTHQHTFSDITGTLPVSKGGTGVTSIEANKLLYAYDLNTVSNISIGSGLSIINNELTATTASSWSTTGNNYTTGNVGIGTNSTHATYKLDIQGTDATVRICDPTSQGNAILALKELDDTYGFDLAYIGNTDNNLYIRSYNGLTTPTTRLTIIRNTGNVGIARTTADYTLDVNSSSFRVANSTYNGGLLMTWNNSESIGETVLWNYRGLGSGRFDFKMRNTSDADVGYAPIVCANISCTAITTTGNTGIGTTNPVRRLHIHDTSTTATGVYAQFTDASANVGANASRGCLIGKHPQNDFLLYNYTQGTNFIFATAPTTTGTVAEAMRITSAGNVGVGTTNPATKFHINGTIRCTEFGVINAAAWDHGRFWHNGSTFYMDAGGSETGIVFRTEATAVGYPAASYSEKMRIQNNGCVGIGQASPVAILHVGSGTYNTGTIIIRYFNLANALTVTSTALTDTCAVFDSSIWVKSWIASSSDARIKKNIIDINDDDALQKILAIQPKKYNYIDNITNTSNQVYGFIAQQIKEIIPEAIDIKQQIVPNIYQICSNTSNGIYFENTSNIAITSNINIDIISENGERNIYTIQDYSDSYIKLDKPLNDSNVFVYGTQVDDFHTLNKDYIFTLNVCAVQELYKIIQNQEARIRELEAKLAT